MAKRRVILVVLDSVGIGHAYDADKFGDEGADTLRAALESDSSLLPNMAKLGIFNIDKNNWATKCDSVIGAYGRMQEASMGKDTTIGHWEIAGVISPKPMVTFPEGFPQELLSELEKQTGRGILCNKPYSGTKVIADYGKEHMETGKLIVYTSADSVLQIAAHENVVPLEELYEICEKARKICAGDWAVGRIIARPFIGDVEAGFTRTSNRHDFSLVPPKKTVLDYIKDAGLPVKAVGKINDIFAGAGVTDKVRTVSNMDGVDKTLEYMKSDDGGIIFTNLVDYDMLYGHRNDVPGYKQALIDFDNRLGEILSAMSDEDVLMITADHGCDPSTPSTDHSRENTPWLVYGKNIAADVNLGQRPTFADIAATIADYLEVDKILADKGNNMTLCGHSLLHKLMPTISGEYQEIAARVDHTLLKVTATDEQIIKLCDEALRFNTASVCVPPSYVKLASEYLAGRIKVCTVIGFPNGYNTTRVKCAETEDAVENGADEIDMVINLGWLKDKKYDEITDEIAQIKKACKGKLLKVIIETCLLEKDEIVRMCKAVADAKADYIKTSTGFSTAGATFENVEIMRQNSSKAVKVKAAGGIANLADAKKFMELGADRLGTSRVVADLITRCEK